MIDATCAVPDCGYVGKLRRGWCVKHYTRWWMHGDPLADFSHQRHRVRPIEQRFFAKVDKRGPVPPDRPDLGACWAWTGRKNHAGYGSFDTPRTERAHRWSYTHLIGAIPDELVLDHLCRNRACVNPQHLEPVTIGENVRRGKRPPKKTHCPSNHELVGRNLVVDKNGIRSCRTCVYDRTREYKRRKRAEAKAPQKS